VLLERLRIDTPVGCRLLPAHEILRELRAAVEWDLGHAALPRCADDRLAACTDAGHFLVDPAAAH